MSIEIAPEGDHIETEKKLKENRHMNGNQTGDSLVNGVSNGYSDKHSKKEHKSEHKDKHREKDRHKDKHKEKHRDKDKHGSSEKHSSSSSKDKEKRHKDEKRDKEKEPKDKEKSSKEKEHKSSSSSSKEKEKQSSSSKDKDRHSSSHRDKEKSSSSSSHKDKSSSSSKDKERHSSSHSSSKDKERHREDKDRKHKEKHRDKEREKEKKPKIEIKEEPESQIEEPVIFDRPPTPRVDIKDEPDFDETMDSQKDYTQDYSQMDDPFYHRDSTLLDTTNDSTCDEPRLVIKSDDEDDEPLEHRKVSTNKRPRSEDDSEDDVPLGSRKVIKQEKKSKKRHSSDSEEDVKPKKKKKKESFTPKSVKKEVKTETTTSRKKKKEEEPEQVWKWWEEEKKSDGTKWKYLEHKGPVFAPAYEPVPKNVKFKYDGKEMELSEETEEIATFYARMLDHDYTTKEVFNTNFFKDWRSVMTDYEKSKITKLEKCDFKQMHQYFLQLSEERKNRTKEEKKALKEQNEAMIKEYGFCTIDGHEEKIGNFKIEPPGLFRGRGEHPKMGKLKKRVVPEDVIINCSKDSKYPVAPEGHKWKEIRHDPSVTWLASWNENVQGQVKYVMLNPSSKLKGEKDWAKYETARKLAKSIEKIRTTYREDWKSKEMRIRQRAVALYFIDKLALRAGNEKDEDQADTVGCCSLRVEHISLHQELDGKENVVVFDFLGKDSIRYYNEVSVEKRVFKNLQLFMQNKDKKDDLFDRLNTAVMNKHLNDLMDGLTAKVFRTYNASYTLQDQLKALTKEDMTVAEKILAYNRANRAVAVLCNHQRAVPKTHEKSMENLKNKIETKRDQVDEAEKGFKKLKKESKHNDSAKTRIELEKKRKALERFREQLQKLEVQATDKEENKEIALGTSKLNYLDPRISVAWCKRFDVPIEKIYNKTQRDKFRWAIDMAGAEYEF